MSPLARLPLAVGLTGVGCLTAMKLPEHLVNIGLGLSFVAGLCVVLSPARKVILRFGPLTWTEHDLCRHILITGDTGSGKTTCGFHNILHQLTERAPKWGGLVLGVKGDEHDYLIKLMADQGQPERLLHLQVRPAEASSHWKPPHRYNLVSDRSLPWTTHAKAIVDTGASLTGGRQDAFFRPMAHLCLAHAFELLDELDKPVTIVQAYRLLTSLVMMDEVVKRLLTLPANSERQRLVEFFITTFLEARAPEQREGIEGTIKTYLSFFLDPDIAHVFSSEEPNTFAISDVDDGKIIGVTMPQRFVTERRYINTYLKMLFYYHALRRYELPKTEQARRNLLLLVADEYQDIVTAAEDGISDHKIVDRIRGAKCAIIAGMQSEVSADPAIGRDKRKVLALNFRTRFIFRAADVEGAAASAEFIGKKKVWKLSKSSKAFDSVTYSRRLEEDYRVKPSALMRLRDKHCVIVHPSKRFSRRRLPAMSHY